MSNHLMDRTKLSVSKWCASQGITLVSGTRVHLILISRVPNDYASSPSIEGIDGRTDER